MSYLKGMGYLVNGVNSTRPYEADMLSCAHCQGLLELVKWREDGVFCRREMKPLCGPCADRALQFGCEPFLKKLEQFTHEQYAHSQFAKIAGLDPPPPQQLIAGGNVK